MLEINKIYNLDCIDGLKELPNDYVDLTVTSPPYDNLRTYHEGDEFVWNFDIFKPIADELYRVTKPGGVVVWVVGDAVINGGETGSSFRQALYFQEIGFKIHDTMIYEKNSSSFPAKETSKRYSQIFEYMFVFTKGKIRNDIKLIADKKNKWAGWTNWGTHTNYDKDGNLVPTTNNKPTPEYSLRNNIWRYTVSFNDKTGHPAVFPERLAQDHILSWSNEGDLVLDPFMGSGTTAKMAMLNKRNYIGFEKSKKYYDESLIRVGKYVGDVNENVVDVQASDHDEVLQLSIDESDKELNGKMELWGKLVKDLEKYFNEQKLEILKNLTFTFKSKSNDDKVKQIVTERGLTGYTEAVEKKEVVVEQKKDDKKYEELVSKCDSIERKYSEIVTKIGELADFLRGDDTQKKEVQGTLFDEAEITVLPKELNDKVESGEANEIVPVQKMSEDFTPEITGKLLEKYIEQTTIPTPKKRLYKVGTEVLFTDGENKGRLGIVQSSSSTEYVVSFNNNDGVLTEVTSDGSDIKRVNRMHQ